MKEKLEIQKSNSPALVLLNKPKGITSFDCIRKLKKHWNISKIGHGGTLDKFADGLLPIFINEGLKCSRFFLENFSQLPTYWKTYVATMRWGVQTDTADLTGTVIQETSFPNASDESKNLIINRFSNQNYLQTPPLYSAKKINGERASDLVRKNKNVELKASEITIKNLNILRWENDKMTFEVTCSKGTYIRSLAEDIAKLFNSTAHLVELKRTSIGNLNLNDSHTLDTVLMRKLEEVSVPLEYLLKDFPSIQCSDFEKSEVNFGRFQEIASRLLKSNLSENLYILKHQNTPISIINISDNKIDFLRNFNHN